MQISYANCVTCSPMLRTPLQRYLSPTKVCRTVQLQCVIMLQTRMATRGWYVGDAGDKFPILFRDIYVYTKSFQVLV